METIGLLALILSYAAFVIYKKSKAFKAGKYCSCGCDHCEASCHKESENI